MKQNNMKTKSCFCAPARVGAAGTDTEGGPGWGARARARARLQWGQLGALCPGQGSKLDH